MNTITLECDYCGKEILACDAVMLSNDERFCCESHLVTYLDDVTEAFRRED